MFANNINELLSIPSNCFGAILSMAMANSGIESYREFQEVLEKKGITGITERRIAEYCKADFTPPFEKAKLMLLALDYPITEEDLIMALKENRKYAKIKPKSYQRKGDREISVVLKLKLSKLLPEQVPERTGFLLDARIEQLCGKKNSYSDYIQTLISKDLNEYILTSESIEAFRGKEKGNV